MMKAKARKVTFYGAVSGKIVIHTTTERRMTKWIEKRMHKITMGAGIVWDNHPDDMWIMREIRTDPDGTEWIWYEHHLL